MRNRQAKMGAIVSAVALPCGRKEETITLWSQSSNQSKGKYALAIKWALWAFLQLYQKPPSFHKEFIDISQMGLRLQVNRLIFWCRFNQTWNFSTVKPTRYTNVSNLLYLEYHSTCFALLMMGGKTARNKWSVIPNKINLRHWCI